ncbi:hypothetical protein GQ457_11G021530 [Hibiscus cannabinus]
MKVIRDTLKSFCDAPVHNINTISLKHKSFFSKITKRSIRTDIVFGFGFLEAQDLGRYLGVPLLHHRVSRATYGYISDKIHARLNSWSATSLSFAGRVTLVKFVLQAIPTYTMQTMWIPWSICLEFEKLIRGFVWANSTKRKGISLVNWEVMKEPIDRGGLGFRDLTKYNMSFLMKVGYQFITEENKLWVRVMRAKYKWDGWIPLTLSTRGGSRLWSDIRNVWHEICKGLIWSVRDGAATSGMKLVPLDRVTEFLSIPFRVWFVANLRDQCEYIKSIEARDVKSGTRLGFRSGHFRSGKIGYGSFQVDLTFRLESGRVQVRFRSGSFQVGFISGRVRSRSGYFRSGPKQIIGRLIRARVDFRSGSFQVGFISGRIHFRSGNFRSGNFRLISFNVGLIGFRICIKFETLSLVQILDRRRRCLVGWVGIVHRWLLGHFE